MTPRKLRLLADCIEQGDIVQDDRRGWANDLRGHAKSVERSVMLDGDRTEFSVPPAQEHPDTAIEWRISYEYCQGGLLGTQHEEWDAFSAAVANEEICAEFVAEITDKMHRNIRIESRGPWVDAARTAPEAQR